MTTISIRAAETTAIVFNYNPENGDHVKIDSIHFVFVDDIKDPVVLKGVAVQRYDDMRSSVWQFRREVMRVLKFEVYVQEDFANQVIVLHIKNAYVHSISETLTNAFSHVSHLDLD